jgi:hypothetical protein
MALLAASSVGLNGTLVAMAKRFFIDNTWRLLYVAVWVCCLSVPSLSIASGAKNASREHAWYGLQLRLVDSVERYRHHDGKPAMRWRTHWTVKWRPHQGVSHYRIHVRTNEGVSKAVPEIAHKAIYQLEVAKGDNPEMQGMLARDAQLLTIANLLSIQIVPVLVDGTPGVASEWLAVGAVN